MISLKSPREIEAMRRAGRITAQARALAGSMVRPGVTTIQGAQLSKKNLEAVNAHILGVIMNGYNAKKTGRRDGYSYAYSYGYYDSNQETDE